MERITIAIGMDGRSVNRTLTILDDGVVLESEFEAPVTLDNQSAGILGRAVQILSDPQGRNA